MKRTNPFAFTDMFLKQIEVYIFNVTDIKERLLAQLGLGGS